LDSFLSNRKILKGEFGMSTEREELIQRLLKIQDGRCFIGEEKIDLSVQKVEIDHIIPRAKGGKDEENNYALLCEYHNRSKSSSDLRVARCMARYELIKENYSPLGHNHPNLGDFLREFGGGKFDMRAQVDREIFKFSLPDIQDKVYSITVQEDKLSRMGYIFLGLPIEYIHHDERINPRAIGPRIRGLLEEFMDGRPQLHIALGWGFIQNGTMKVRIFDGQHKAAAQILLGIRKLPVRVFLNPDLNVLLETNTNAGTTLRQVAFDKATQRFLGSQIYWEKIDEYRKATGRGEDDLSFCEKDLIQFFRGEHREIKKYIVDDVRVGIIHHPDSKLKNYIEFSGRGTEKPLSYSTIEKTIFAMFIRKEPLSLPLGDRLEIGENPRQLEKEQLVRLMNIIADEIFVGKYDLDIGAGKVEERIRKGDEIPDAHLRAVRMSREEICYNWLRYVRDLIRRYFLMKGQVIEEEELFQHKFSEDLWGLLAKLIRNIGNLPLWINKPLSSTVFGGKQDYDYWKVIFETGKSRDGQQVLAKPLNLDDLIS
jgi:hypothetical protein